MVRWVKDLTLLLCGSGYSCGVDSNPGPGISACHECSQEKKEKKITTTYIFALPHLLYLTTHFSSCIIDFPPDLVREFFIEAE